MFIGIAGPSCSGKTTLARELSALLDLPLHHLDAHFVKDADHPLVNGYPSYEQPHQYDGKALLEKAKQEEEGCILEGFLLYNYDGALELCDYAFYLDVPHEELVRRRSNRSKAGTDGVRAVLNPKVDEAWHAHGKEEWEAYGASQMLLPSVNIIKSEQHGGTYPNDIKEMGRKIMLEIMLS